MLKTSHIIGPILFFLFVLCIPATTYAEKLPYTESLHFKISQDRKKETLATQEVFLSFLKEAKSLRRTPPKALGNDDYDRLVTELRNVGKRMQPSEGDNTHLKLLARRIYKLLDPKLTGACQKLKLDLESVKLSGGDWKKVKDKNGKPIPPSSHKHTKLFWYYASGCGDSKDFVTARKVLFDISDLEPKSKSKRSKLRPDIRHCKAELWARHGIGGPIDDELADTFLRRFKDAAWNIDENTKPDELAKLAKQYPEGARNNFECPRNSKASYIDPRDPWKDL
jgi:hypothetical protein